MEVWAVIYLVMLAYVGGYGMSWLVNRGSSERERRAVAASEAASAEMGRMRDAYVRRVGELADAGLAAMEERDDALERQAVADGYAAETLQGARALFEYGLRVSRERDEARASVALVLTYWGRERARREAVEVELERERVVSAGLESLIGGGS
ncbi:hypothetical protein L332_03425 [Agrococcus pavilionensis RW1]|uniref:Uncharacterized protein n=1 Tax=Agrococcus pavilionensis RW1 TaxID=1330458 RepID=U1MNN2_9MICO|nr:hypothetical protein [Agrococcus pavilionensis]ERG63506.1 hypothetical protein L332_03425 [Agrococcus pavilionensis RW1]